ncbi:hypothetical protein MAR_016076 [Mya arenaria]|uniref:Uncharacterized protein n=1 Tax=Mya arenaria TaxID=6604 RepID=A0ABY7FIZ1_MYAAR|nr:hypothetical protein MAR_016076 [Mya arenaria]
MIQKLTLVTYESDHSLSFMTFPLNLIRRMRLPCGGQPSRPRVKEGTVRACDGVSTIKLKKFKSALHKEKLTLVTYESDHSLSFMTFPLNLIRRMRLPCGGQPSRPRVKEGTVRACDGVSTIKLKKFKSALHKEKHSVQGKKT